MNPEQPQKKKILFVCIHNSIRSQIAEALLNHVAGDIYTVSSAGIEMENAMNPFVIESLRQIGIDHSRGAPKDVFKLYQSGHTFHYVITLCDEVHAEKCPVFPGVTHRLYWNFEDLSRFSGSDEELLEKISILRDHIKANVEDFVKNPPSVAL